MNIQVERQTQTVTVGKKNVICSAVVPSNLQTPHSWWLVFNYMFFFWKEAQLWKSLNIIQFSNEQSNQSEGMYLIISEIFQNEKILTPNSQSLQDSSLMTSFAIANSATPYWNSATRHLNSPHLRFHLHYHETIIASEFNPFAWNLNDIWVSKSCKRFYQS